MPRREGKVRRRRPDAPDRYWEGAFPPVHGTISGAHNRTALIGAHDVERVLADIDANHGDCSVGCLAKPADLSIEQPTKFDLVVNLSAANGSKSTRLTQLRHSEWDMRQVS